MLHILLNLNNKKHEWLLKILTRLVILLQGRLILFVLLQFIVKQLVVEYSQQIPLKELLHLRKLVCSFNGR